MVIASWPRGGDWTAALCEHFSNGRFARPADGLDLIERWSRAGRAGTLPLLPDGSPVTVHGRLGLVDDFNGGPFLVVVTWTPWTADDGFSTEGDTGSCSRSWAEAEVDRFLGDPQRFSPSLHEGGFASGLFNKLDAYVGQRIHVTDRPN